MTTRPVDRPSWTFLAFIIAVIALAFVIAAFTACTPSPATARAASALTAPLNCNVLDYGAAGDGVTDDRAAFQSALDTCAGATVYVPIGVYDLGQNGGNFWCVAIHAGTTLRGESRTGSVLRMRAGVGPSVQLLQVESAPDVTLLDLTLDGAATAQTVDPHRAGIFAKFSPRLAVRHVTALGFTGDGIYIYDGSDDALVDDVLAIGNGRNGLTLGGSTTGGVFRGSQFVGNVAEQFDSEGGPQGGPIDDVTITGCTFDALGASNDYVLTMTGSSAAVRSARWTVTDNVVNGSALAVWITDVLYARNTGVNTSDKPSVRVYRSCDRVRIEDNILSTTTPAAFDAGALVYVTGTDPGQAPGGVVIARNVLSTTAPAFGVSAICARDVQVSDNVIRGVGAIGVFVRATRVDEPVRSALIERNAVSGFGVGVLLGGNGAAKIWRAAIEDNVFTGATAALSLDDGLGETLDVTQARNTADGALMGRPASGAMSAGDGQRWVVAQ